MEGLIPLVYKAIKRNRGRQQQQGRSLSSSVQTPYFFVIDDDQVTHHHQYTTSASTSTTGAAQSNYLYITPPAVSMVQQNATTGVHVHHRRHNSVPLNSLLAGDHDRGFGTAEVDDDDHRRRAKAKQLVRFRSHRSSSLFSSCISGAA